MTQITNLHHRTMQMDAIDARARHLHHLMTNLHHLGRDLHHLASYLHHLSAYLHHPATRNT